MSTKTSRAASHASPLWIIGLSEATTGAAGDRHNRSDMDDIRLLCDYRLVNRTGFHADSFVCDVQAPALQSDGSSSLRTLPRDLAALVVDAVVVESVDIGEGGL